MPVAPSRVLPGGQAVPEGPGGCAFQARLGLGLPKAALLGRSSGVLGLSRGPPDWGTHVGAQRQGAGPWGPTGTGWGAGATVTFAGLSELSALPSTLSLAARSPRGGGLPSPAPAGPPHRPGLTPGGAHPLTRMGPHVAAGLWRGEVFGPREGTLAGDLRLSMRGHSVPGWPP